MLDSFTVKKPFYPLISFFVSIAGLVFGMLISKSLWVFAFAALMLMIYFSFGMAKSTLKVLSAMLILGLIVGGLAFITNRSITSFWQTVGRMILLGVCAVPMISVPPAELIRCLNKMKCPRMITLGMLITIRFIPIIISEIRQIWEAMRVRGVKMAWYRPDCIYRAFLLPLIMRIIGISDILSLSLETRGFQIDNSAATIYRPVSVKVRDFIFLFLVFFAMAGTGVLKCLVH
ncbi:MAG: energy-coupling factor transporter transmembrane protein EcfT [Faecalibacterium sp.]|nr:energy-coupling factor transporter transmembrane protein EcfT [Faecalibacterium sp.]